MQVTGTIVHIGQTETVGQNNFTKRLVVVKTDEQYPQEIPVEFVKDKTTILDQYRTGQHVTVDINLRGNPYNGKWFLSAQGWRISADQQQPAAAPTAGIYNPTPNGGGDTSDLPFRHRQPRIIS